MLMGMGAYRALEAIIAFSNLNSPFFDPPKSIGRIRVLGLSLCGSCFASG